MANNNNYNKPPYNNSRPQYKPYAQPAPPAEIKASPLPADYVDVAEQVMSQLSTERFKITTSKIRNLLSLVSNIYNTENLRTESTILPESQTGLTMLRIRMVYEAGRDPATKTFLLKAKLLEYLKDISTDRSKLIHFAHYMEALVAYHRFYIGGREG